MYNIVIVLLVLFLLYNVFFDKFDNPECKDIPAGECKSALCSSNSNCKINYTDDSHTQCNCVNR